MASFSFAGKNFEIFNPQKTSLKGLLIFLFVILLLGGVASSSLRNSNTSNPTEEEKNDKSSLEPISSFVSNHTLVYGIWNDKNSVIKAQDLSNGKTYILATLPSNIKKVSLIPPNQLIFIDKTNEKDHGEEVVIYNLSTKQAKTLIKAKETFGIDDYVLSPDKKLLADWEVSFLGQSNALRGGRSQVNSVVISSPNLKNLIYDEIVNNPIHYPVGITNDGEIFLDKFLPNSGTGWAYGMSISNFTGTSKQELSNMQNGTYGTQPTLSPDGKYLVFGGYKGLDGKEIISGNRKAILSSNSIDLLDTQIKERTTITENYTEEYSTPTWDKETGNITFATLYRDGKNKGFFLYDFNSKSVKEVPFRYDQAKMRLVSPLSLQRFLFGELSSSMSSIGNLGNKYAFPFTKLLIFDSSTSETNPVSISDNYIQFILLAQNNSFENIESFAEDSGLSLEKRTLQIETFALKPKLAKKRIEQQSSPETRQEQPTSNGDDGNMSDEERKLYEQDCSAAGTEDQIETCMGTPLYLYGTVGQKIKVLINNPVFSSLPVYSNGYNITLLEDGKMMIDNDSFEKISYDFIPSKKIVEPDYGIVALRENLLEILKFYSLNLGLNSKETKDLIEGTKNISSPYVFVSFFDRKTSKEILPIEFSPKPDVYINNVFYLKGLNELPKELPKKPVFESMPFRYGFTAVEVSWIIK